MRKKVVLLIDAGHLRAQAQRENQDFCIPFIQSFTTLCVSKEDEELHKVLYYDCPNLLGKQAGPYTGKPIDISQPDNFLNHLEKLDFFAVRKGTNKFRGWKRKGQTKSQIRAATSDLDFKADIQQKGVDTRIALDIAIIANKKYVDRIILVSNDSDLTPAMKYARQAGLQVVLVKLPGMVNQAPMLPHVDIARKVEWPTKSTKPRPQTGASQAKC